jgi:hypothetical protein
MKMTIVPSTQASVSQLPMPRQRKWRQRNWIACSPIVSGVHSCEMLIFFCIPFRPHAEFIAEAEDTGDVSIDEVGPTNTSSIRTYPPNRKPAMPPRVPHCGCRNFHAMQDTISCSEVDLQISLPPVTGTVTTYSTNRSYAVNRCIPSFAPHSLKSLLPKAYKKSRR